MFFKSTYPNEANTQGVCKCESFYPIHDLGYIKKYSHLELDIFWCMGKKH
jgi:hypothetical protein